MKKSVLCFLLVTGLEGGNSALEYSSPLLRKLVRTGIQFSRSAEPSITTNDPAMPVKLKPNPSSCAARDGALEAIRGKSGPSVLFKRPM
jgi:hypothetical protein